MQADFIFGKLLSYTPQPVSVVLRQLAIDVQNIVALKPTGNGLARILVSQLLARLYNSCIAEVAIEFCH